MIFIFIFIFYFSCSEFSSCWVVGKMPVRMFLHREQRNFIVVCCAMWRRMFRFRLIITRVRTNKQTNKLSPPRDSQIATTERSPPPGAFSSHPLPKDSRVRRGMKQFNTCRALGNFNTTSSNAPLFWGMAHSRGPNPTTHISFTCWRLGGQVFFRV
jgi:hypothetical protein